VIELQGLGKSYSQDGRALEILKSVDLRAQRGDFISLMGSSGAGKSTLLQILGCLDTPTKGNYLLDGTNVAELDEKARAEIRNRKIGFVFQSSFFVDYLSLLDNVALPALYGKSRLQGSDRARAAELLKHVGLSHRQHHLPAALSGGERQRAALARALFNRPLLLLADEPTGNLDRNNAQRVMTMLRDLQSPEHVLMVVTHDPDIAAQASTRLHLGSQGLENHASAAA